MFQISNSQNMTELSIPMTGCAVMPQLFDGVKSLLQSIGTACAQAAPQIMMSVFVALVNKLIESAGDSIAEKIPDIVSSFKRILKKFGKKVRDNFFYKGIKIYLLL